MLAGTARPAGDPVPAAEEFGAAAVSSTPTGWRGESGLAKRHIPERSCVACGQKSPKRGLVRIVRTPQGAVMVDRTGKSAGRGAYLCWTSTCWERGMGKGRLERSLNAAFSAQDREQLWAFFLESADSIPSESNN